MAPVGFADQTMPGQAALYSKMLGY